MNDSKYFPNCKMKKVMLEAVPYLCIFATRDIEISEEITYYYGVDELPWHEEVCSMCLLLNLGMQCI